MSREYAWSERGKIVIGEKSGKRFARESFVAGLKNKQVLSPMCYKGTMNTSLFNFWLINFLIPTLSPGDTVVMDNATFHKSEETNKIITDAGCELIFLPPYSPDLNPIEKFWANLKNIIKRNIANFCTLADAIDYAFRVDHLNSN